MRIAFLISVFQLFSFSALAQQVRINFTDPNWPPASEFRLSIGSRAGVYTNSFAITNGQVINATTGTWFAVVHAISVSSVTSAPSSEFTFSTTNSQQMIEVVWLRHTNAATVRSQGKPFATNRVPASAVQEYYALRISDPNVRAPIKSATNPPKARIVTNAPLPSPTK